MFFRKQKAVESAKTSQNAPFVEQYVNRDNKADHAVHDTASDARDRVHNAV